MKLLLLIVVTLVIAGGVYLFISVRSKGKIKKNKKYNSLPLKIASIVFIILLAIIFVGAYVTANQPDLQCTSSHATTSKQPSSLNTSKDYFLEGNYDYDIGNCSKAVTDYTKAIELNPNYFQAYNNRGYTNMRLHNYKDALPDLDKAIQLSPRYVQAHMNRGDIHNYYYQIDRQSAVADYKRVIAITGPGGGNTSVCGHLFLAEHNDWTLGAFFDLFTGEFRTCN